MTTKPPIIRKGQLKPYTKATRKEFQQRLRAAALLEYMEWEISSIYWFFQEVFGVGPRQTARYRAHTRAREAA